jgi:hypothetical protein
MAVGDAIRSYAGIQRMAIVGAGACHTGSGHHFDRWFLERLERGELDQVLDMPDSEIELAGNGTHEMGSGLAVAGAVAPNTATTLAYECPSTHGSRVWAWRNGKTQST